MLWDSILRNAVGLLLFAAITVGVIAVTEYTTRDAIVEQREAARRRALLEILPAEAFDNAILEDVMELDAAALGLEEAEPAYIARRDGIAVAAMVPVRIPDGQAARSALLGVRPDGSVVGVRTLEHRETPGLGDKIELRKSDWIKSFDDRSSRIRPLMAGQTKDGGALDGFTGATITPRAVITGVSRALHWFEDEGRRALFGTTEEQG